MNKVTSTIVMLLCTHIIVMIYLSKDVLGPFVGISVPAAAFIILLLQLKDIKKKKS